MIYIAENILPICAATGVGIIIGLLWLRYSADSGLGVVDVAVAVLAEFWIAAILAGALILAPTQADAWTMALGSAFIIWVGFVMPAFVITLRAGHVATRRIVSVCLHWLVVMLAQAATLQAIGLTAPPPV